MEFLEAKKQFLNEVIKQGWRGIQDVPGAFMADIPVELKAKWFERLKRNPKLKFNLHPRLINPFMIGADPEFVMFDPAAGGIIHGNTLGFRTGLAFGVDSNGRLIEIRPAPSQSALSVLTSTLVTMRWLALMYPETLGYMWRAGAFIQRDGLGGHIHIGRKKGLQKLNDYYQVRFGNGRPRGRLPATDEAGRFQIPPDIVALDSLCAMLTQVGVYPAEEMTLRRAGDQFGQRYGQYGDIRPQKHGYEYRTFPSWLDSPWMAYLSLVLTKLVVRDPQPWTGSWDMVQQGASPKKIEARIAAMLGKYAPQDDDARVALSAMECWGLPKFQGGDFKARWGLNYPQGKGVKTSLPGKNLPESITPSEAELREVFCHLANKSPLSAIVPTAYWPLADPEGYESILAYTDTTRIPGLGELLRGMVTAKDPKLPRISFNLANGAHFEMGSMLAGSLKANWRNELVKLLGASNTIATRGAGRNIGLSHQLRESHNHALVRKALLSGIFPIWELSKVTPDSYKDWSNREAEVKGTKTSKVIFQT